nr:DUF1707 domain-containing protein [Nocardia bovistercoris]
MRARDLDRANASSVLDAAYAEGQLAAAEYHERTAAAARAKTIGELDGLISDLQSPTAVRDLAGQSAQKTRNPLTRRRFSGGYPPRTRARDTDRAETVRALDAARADGQLAEDEHTALTELAAEARTLGDLADLSSDLQERPDAAPAPRPPRSIRPLLARVAVVATAVVVGVGCFVLTFREEEIPPVPTPAVDLSAVDPLVMPTPNLVTPEGLALFRERYRAKFGDTVVDELRTFDDFATVQRMAPEGPLRSVKYDYRGGFQRSGGPETYSRERDLAPLDLATFDFELLRDALRDAPALTKVPQGVVSSLAFEVYEYNPYKGRSTVQISVRNERDQYGDVLVSATGEVLKITEVR